MSARIVKRKRNYGIPRRQNLAYLSKGGEEREEGEDGSPVSKQSDCHDLTMV